MNAHAATEAMLAESIEHDLFLASAPEHEAERLADIHRRMVKKHESRLVDTRNGLKAALATLAASAKAERQRHAEAMAQIAERTAEAREVARRDTAADQKVAAKARAFLKAGE
jgi:hypothetical protein